MDTTDGSKKKSPRLPVRIVAGFLFLAVVLSAAAANKALDFFPETKKSLKAALRKSRRKVD